jgi:hypothetical protein
MNRFRSLIGALALAAAPWISAPAAAADPVTKSMCVYDPSGAAGDAFQHAKKFQAQALSWGVNFTLKAYTDEGVAAADFRNKKCDAAVITGVRTQQFNRKSYTVEALGLISSYEGLRKAVNVLSGPKAEPLMKSGEFETIGIFPAGAVYLYVDQKASADVSALAGKKICTMDFDAAAKVMVARVGAQAEPSDIGTFASKFNNHSCNVAYAPATAYKPLELYKGVGANGGVVRLPISQLTLQVLIRSAEYPAGFGQLSRTWAATQFDGLLGVSKKAEAGIEASKWIEVDATKAASYRKMMGEARAELVGKGAYDPTVAKLLEQVAGAQ